MQKCFSTTGKYYKFKNNDKRRGLAEAVMYRPSNYERQYFCNIIQKISYSRPIAPFYFHQMATSAMLSANESSGDMYDHKLIHQLAKTGNRFKLVQMLAPAARSGLRFSDVANVGPVNPASFEFSLED